jgi:hypothetical protein
LKEKSRRPDCPRRTGADGEKTKAALRWQGVRPKDRV